MQNRKVLCVDLGSAYTKVALRNDWDGTAELLRDLPLADETTFCVPSLLAKVTRGTNVQWLCGSDAAAQRQSPDVELFRYWKEPFFERTSRSEIDYIEVATQFFRQLTTVLTRGRHGVDPTKYPARVCIPKLSTVTDGEDRILKVLKDAGWKPALERPTVFEPEANALGVFSRGRNFTWRPSHGTGQRSAGRSTALRKMFEDEVIKAYERVAGSYSVLAIDVGAYTTDFGFVRLDTSFTEEWTLPEVLQESVKLGVKELDQAVRLILSQPTRQALQASNPWGWETHKALLYSGKEAAVLGAAGEQIILGQGDERTQIDTAIEDFSTRVIVAGQQFLAGIGSPRIDMITVTGGGAMIPRLRSRVFSTISTSSRQIDLLDRDEPTRSVPFVHGRQDQRLIDARGRLNRDLIRGGSALGGASVFFG